MPSGRPKLYPGGHQLNVFVSGEEYEVLSALVNRARVEHPNYSFSDIVRVYIRRGLAEEPRPFKRHLADPNETPARRLYVIARMAQRLARELGN
jgi:hypothetical protein